MKKIVLTGAAGRLGSYLREPLLKLAQELVSSDIVEEIGNLHPNETYVSADLSDLPAMIELLKGADLVVHFGAIGDEAPFDEILQANIVGAYNIWEAAYQNGVKRVVYASSIHAVGMHKKTDFIGTDVPHRPDTYYGLAKCFAEDLASLYWDKRGLESVCMRILSCAQVSNPRAVGSWLSYDDLIQLVEKSITLNSQKLQELFKNNKKNFSKILFAYNRNYYDFIFKLLRIINKNDLEYIEGKFFDQYQKIIKTKGNKINALILLKINDLCY